MPPWYWSGVRTSSATSRIGPQHLLEEEVAGAHEHDRDLLRWRQHRVGEVVDAQVVVGAQPCRHDAAPVVAERQHDRASHIGLERHIALGDRLAVELQPEAERLRLA
jgi:hypothetical protein